MSEQTNKPNFDSIRQETAQGIEYWSARNLAPLLGYNVWQNFETAIKRAKTACEQIGQNIADHINGAINMIEVGKGAKREFKDHLYQLILFLMIS